MIKNSEIMDMGNAAIKGFRFKAAGATFWGNLIILIAIFPFVFIFEEFKEPNVLSLENIFIDLVSNIVATSLCNTRIHETSHRPLPPIQCPCFYRSLANYNIVNFCASVILLYRLQVVSHLDCTAN